MNRSERKIVLITGARSGIGRACADALVAQGHQVYGYESYSTVGDPRIQNLADGCQ